MTIRDQRVDHSHALQPVLLIVRVARPGEALGQRTGRGTRAWRDDLQRVGGCSSRCGGPSDRPRTGRGPSPRCTCPAGRCVLADTGEALPSASPHREGTYVRYECKIMAPWPLCGSHLTREAPSDDVPSALGRPLRPSPGSSTRADWSRRAMAPTSPRSQVDRRQAALSHLPSADASPMSWQALRSHLIRESCSRGMEPMNAGAGSLRGCSWQPRCSLCAIPWRVSSPPGGRTRGRRLGR